MNEYQEPTKYLQEMENSFNSAQAPDGIGKDRLAEEGLEGKIVLQKVQGKNQSDGWKLVSVLGMAAKKTIK